MPNLTRLNDFQAGNIIVSSAVDDEFNQILNAVNLLPDKDGTLQTNLNADLVDNFHVSATGGDQKIPICDADVLQVALNADLLDGLHASDIAEQAFPADTELLFHTADPPGGWNEQAAPATERYFSWKSGQDGGTTPAGRTWNISGITITVNNHTLLIGEIPSHSHGMTHTHDLSNHTHTMNNHTHSMGAMDNDVGGTSGTTLLYADNRNITTLITINPATGAPSTNITAGPSSNITGAASNSVTGNQGGGTGHNHTGSASQDGNWRPPAESLVIGKKAA